MRTIPAQQHDPGPSYSNAPPAPLVLSVFFEGTHNEIEPVTTQVGWFFAKTRGVDITSTDARADTSTSTEFKMGFDGCGVVCGLLGTVFALGLASQCSCVVQRVHELMQSGRPLRLNCFGLSRGGCACLMLARRLASLDPGMLAISLCLFDPVPGNSLTVARYLDVCGLSTAAACMDVSGCRPLRSVLALYPYEALSDLLLHAPLLPAYPPENWCEVEEDATLGCHQGALYPPRGEPASAAEEPAPASPSDLACLLSFVRVKTFLEQCGTPLASAGVPLLEDFEVQQRRCLRGMAAALAATAAPAHRLAHHFRGGGGAIVRHARGQFLNLHHRLLASASSCVDLRKLAEAEASTQLDHSPRTSPRAAAGGVARGGAAGAGGSLRLPESRDSPVGLHRRALGGGTVGQWDLSSTPTYMLEVLHGDAKPSLLWRLARRALQFAMRRLRQWSAVSSAR